MKPIQILNKILAEIDQTSELNDKQVKKWGTMLNMIENDGNYVRFKTTIRKAIKNKFFDGDQYALNDYLYPLGFDNSNRTIRQNELAAANQEKAHNNVFTISKTKYATMYNIIKNAIAQNPIWVFPMLVLLCGCRIGEAVYFSNFAYDKKYHDIIQQGILKRRDDKDVAIIKPVLLELDEKTINDYIDLCEKQREILDIKKDPQIAVSNVLMAIRPLNDIIEKVFGAKGTSHDLRKIYAYLASTIRRPPKTSANLYREYLLGHQKPKLDNYMSRF